MHAIIKELTIFGSPRSKPSFKFSFDVPSNASAKREEEKKKPGNRVPPNKEINKESEFFTVRPLEKNRKKKDEGGGLESRGQFQD